MKQTINLTVNGIDFGFDVTPEDHNNLINEIMPNNKVAPNFNFLNRTVKPEQKEELQKFLDKHNGSIIQLGGTVAAAFAPQLEIEIKK